MAGSDRCVQQGELQMSRAPAPGAVAGRLTRVLTTALLVLAGPLASAGVGVSPAAATTPTPVWTQLSPAASPPVRFDASLAYDPGMGKLLLFGGVGSSSGSEFRDTWTWDGTTWAHLTPAASPPARYGASLAYDPGTSQLVLFGGVSTSSGTVGDTWTWD